METLILTAIHLPDKSTIKIKSLNQWCITLWNISAEKVIHFIPKGMGEESCNSSSKNGTRQITMIGMGNSAIRQCCVVGDNFKSSTDHCL
jgi:hypothetical protein